MTGSFSAASPATGSQSGDTWTGQSASTFNLTATVTDLDGRTGSHTFLITVLSGGPPC